MKKTVILNSGIDGFIDDKDEAKRIRLDVLLPTLEKSEGVVIDFKNVKTSTQSFVHALLGEVLIKYKEPALQRLEFRNCSPQLKTLVEIVVDYSLGGFHPPQESKDEDLAQTRSRIKKTEEQ